VSDEDEERCDRFLSSCHHRFDSARTSFNHSSSQKTYKSSEPSSPTVSTAANDCTSSFLQHSTSTVFSVHHHLRELELLWQTSEESRESGCSVRAIYALLSSLPKFPRCLSRELTQAFVQTQQVISFCR